MQHHVPVAMWHMAHYVMEYGNLSISEIVCECNILVSLCWDWITNAIIASQCENIISAHQFSSICYPHISHYNVCQQELKFAIFTHIHICMNYSKTIHHISLQKVWQLWALMQHNNVFTWKIPRPLNYVYIYIYVIGFGMTVYCEQYGLVKFDHYL